MPSTLKPGNYRTNKLLITGGSGYLGACILRRAPFSWTVAATSFTQSISQEHVLAFRLDVRDEDAVAHLFDEFRPNVVIHTAAIMSGSDLDSTNTGGSRNIARAAVSNNARLIHLSSDVIFDGEHAPYTEQSPPSPITPYGESKALAEKAVLAECPDAVVVRTSLIYGFEPFDPRTRQTLDGEMPRLFSDEYRCPIWVEDLASALVELATSPFAGILNVAGPQRLSRYDFGVKLARTFGIPPRFAPALSASSPTRRPCNCTLDISLARTLLKTRLRSVDAVLGLAAPPQNPSSYL